MPPSVLAAGVPMAKNRPHIGPKIFQKKSLGWVNRPDIEYRIRVLAAGDHEGPYGPK